jgi:hypothetical protein
VKRLRRIFIVIILAAMVLQQAPASAYTMLPQFLCDLGEEYYRAGRYDDALTEFNKALVLEPDSPVALKYIKLIQGAASAEAAIPAGTPEGEPRKLNIEKALEEFETPAVHRTTVNPRKQPVSQPDVIVLDANLASRRMPIQLPRDRKLTVRGLNIQRFLITEPNVLRGERTGADELTLICTDLGYTYVHVWDERDRWTLEILGVGPKPEGVPTLEEEILGGREKDRDFKLRYALTYQTFESGPDIRSLKRSSYSWNHWLSLEGPIPYGDLDVQGSISEIPVSTDLTYLTAGLTNGRFGNFENFNLRLVDFTPNITDLAFSSTALRGAYFNSKAFENRVDYTAFWGKEGGGKYWGLSPGLVKPRNSYIDGVEFNFIPEARQLYSLSAFQGYGSDRQADLNSTGYDFKTWLGFDRWDYRYEGAYDSRTLANLFSAGYHIPNLAVSTELRNTDKEFKTMTGTGWRAGETGILTAASYRASDKLDLGSRLDIYRDSLFPNPDDKQKLNEDLNFDGNYRIDDSSSARIDYTLADDLGKISPMRSHNGGAGIYKAFGENRWFNAYVTYRHQENTFFTSHINDYSDEKILLGIRFAVIGDLFYYLTHEYNWLLARFYGTRSNPQAIETGLDWNRRILNSPFYGDFRMVYRNEEDTTSPVSFLAGEDYLEWSAEVTYRPNPDLETFVSGRLRNVWPENTTTPRRADLNIYAGLRYTWDTGFKWDPVGDIEGFVFKDENQDGLRETGEGAVSGVKIKAGKGREIATDENGYFYVNGIRGRKCAVAIDTATIPSGFVLTTPAVQEIDIKHGSIEVINFGVISRTEIAGYIFEDTNGDGAYGSGDKGVKGVIVILENGKKAVTDSSGKYVFSKLSPGPHKLTLDIDSLSPDLLPSVSVYKEMDLQEGALVTYNIPCKRVDR